MGRCQYSRQYRALLLDDNSRIRFVPTSSGSATFSYYGWDQSTGTTSTKVNTITRGNTTAYILQFYSASISVTSDAGEPPAPPFNPPANPSGLGGGVEN
jgi:hypothetical protein